MLSRIPFSAYDFFGFLSSGFLLLAAADYALGFGWVLRDDIGATQGILLVVAAYVAGQAIASPAAWLYEGLMVERVLGRPSANLLRTKATVRWKVLFPGYFAPLPRCVSEKLRARARDEGIEDEGEPVFLHALTRARSDASTAARLETFLNNYGFSRNVSFALLIATALITVDAVSLGNTGKIPVALLTLTGSVALFYRYLKFLRQYSFEVFITYAA